MENPQKITTVWAKTIGDGLGVHDWHRGRTYILNTTTAIVWQHCDGQTTPQQLAELLQRTFDVPQQQAEGLLELALDELGKADLLQTSVERPPNPSQRQFLNSFAKAGLSPALIPVVAPVMQAAARSTDLPVHPILERVVGNGDGTFTAFFGYLNENNSTVTIPIGPSNEFTPAPHDRGQPTEFLPGRQVSVFAVDFQGDQELKWKLKP